MEGREPLDFSRAPRLVFWETTRACGLSCIHCRASAIPQPLPGELTKDEGLRLIDQVAAFGPHPPVLVFTGGDPLRRPDLGDLLAHAHAQGIKTAVSPAVTDLLTEDVLGRLRERAVSSISLSLDGATSRTHDGIRRKEGTYERTVEAMKDARRLGLGVQVNTAVMRGNVEELPGVLHLLRTLGIPTWEVFFLVQVGRATNALDLTPDEYESVCNFLYDASRYGVVVRTVEAPFLRRVARMREREAYWNAPLYRALRSDLLAREGVPEKASTVGHRGTLDGDGILFVAHDGTVQAGGLLPMALGDVRTDALPTLYRQDRALLRIRRREFGGLCGACAFRDLCGGSRARAYAHTLDPFASDPACLLVDRQGSGGAA